MDLHFLKKVHVFYLFL